MLHCTSLPVLPSYDSLGSPSQSFAAFFSVKIHKLHIDILSNHARTSPQIPPLFTPPNFFIFLLLSIDEVPKLFSQSTDTNCEIYPIPICLLKQYTAVLPPTVTEIINLSLSTSMFHDKLKICSVHPHLKSQLEQSKSLKLSSPFLTCLSCLNSLKELLNFVSLITCLITVYKILFSLLTSVVILLTVCFCLFMTSSLRLQVFSKLLI
jgi:hypothetical protein